MPIGLALVLTGIGYIDFGKINLFVVVGGYAIATKIASVSVEDILKGGEI